jgi:dolichyl-phosphate-mannose-protein mannosyltransferase
MIWNDRSPTWKWPIPILVAVVGAAAVIRAAHLTGFQGLTGDEGFTLALAQRSLPHMLYLFTFEANGLLYALLEWPLIRIHESLLVLRLPALLAGVLAVAALYWAARPMAGRAAALAASALIALNPLAVSYSQFARPYVFAMLFGTIAYGCLARAGSDRRYWSAYVVAMALAGYSNALSLALIPAQAVFVLEDRRLLRRWLLSLVVLLATLVPLAALLVVERSKRNPLYWLSRPSVGALEDLARVVMAGRGGILLAVLVLAGVAVTGRGRHRRLASIGAWAILPPLTVFAVAQVSPIFWVGYLLPALPGAVLLVSAAATRLPRAFALAAFVLFAGLFARGTLFHETAYHQNGWQEAARALASERRANPVVFDIPDGLVADGYYDRHLAARDGHLVVSEWRDESLPAGVTLRDDPGGYWRVPVGPPSRELLARLVRKTGSEFLMLYDTGRQGDILRSPGLQWAARACREKTGRFGGIEMIRITQCRSRP